MRQIETLLKNKVNFLTDSKADDDIAISSRIRLARNLKRFPFPSSASDAMLAEIRDLVLGAAERSGCLGKNALCFDLSELSEADGKILFERRLASRELLARKLGSELICSRDESLSVMVNEEDHLRLQAIKSGFRLEEAFNELNTVDDCLSRILEYAFDDTLGYLTCCPTNVGTGLRASVMLHLPALVLSGEIKAAVRGIGKLNLAVRGIFGEGTENLGNLFQVSNQSTLGESEIQILHSLRNVIAQLINYEKNARITLLEKDPNMLLDRVGRAFGVMRHAYKLTDAEAVENLSFLRLGVDMGMFNNIDLATVNELFIRIGEAHLLHDAKKSADAPDVLRAAMVRERLRDNGN